jgi:aspartate/methionine/tyrosine aminotransferase
VERYANLTQYERVSLGQAFNLADGHAKQYQDEAQEEIRQRLPEIYRASERVVQPDVERDFQAAFFALAGQESAIAHPHTLLCTSASLATDLIATFLSHAGHTVSLIQPCFDNLATILVRRRIAPIPLAEQDITPARLAATFQEMVTDAVFLTFPNNPTGFVLDREEFASLAGLCAQREKILILDWTFRFFSELDEWDQYEILERSGVSYICIEDTGKTWPTLDLKCSIMATSADMYRKILEVHNDVLLNVSPFVLLLLTEYIHDSQRRGLDASVRRAVALNRQELRAALRQSVLVPVPAAAPVSVEWVRLDSTAVKSVDVVALLADVGIGILPGDHFFWSDPSLGSRFVRFALARDPATFTRVCSRIQSVIAGQPTLGGRPLVA